MAGTTMKKPSRQELEEARSKTVADVIAPGLQILFCGINPGLYSAATGFHFARPGNRFWPALHRAGFTPRQFAPCEEAGLLQLGYGITNLVRRTTASAAELAEEEFVAGQRRLLRKIKRYQPRIVAVLGVGAYRHAFADRSAVVGLQEARIDETSLWVLPSPSGLNAHYQIADLVEQFRELHRFATERVRERNGISHR